MVNSFLGFDPETAIVVTGGASGIGEALAITAARQGLSVAVWDIDGDGAKRTAEAINSAGGRGASFAVDVSDRAAVAKTWEGTTSALGPVSCLGAVAGPSSFSDRPLMDGVMTALDCYRLPTEAWIEQPAPATRSAVYFASVMGTLYGLGPTWYAVAKNAIDGYTRSLAAMRPGGIRANAILPDLILTPRTKRLIETTGGTKWDRNPMGRVGQAQDVANAALFLLSPAAEYVNGVSLVIDGGCRLVSLPALSRDQGPIWAPDVA